jgi:hypothetical protein
VISDNARFWLARTERQPIKSRADPRSLLPESAASIPILGAVSAKAASDFLQKFFANCDSFVVKFPCSTAWSHEADFALVIEAPTAGAEHALSRA